MDQQVDRGAVAIRDLNDQFRCNGLGRGSVLVTEGVNAVDEAFAHKAMTAVRSFDQFDQDNDPHGEHDFGALVIDGQELFFKIDYYDLAMTHHSPNAADPAVTHRVLTIMLRNEY